MTLTYIVYSQIEINSNARHRTAQHPQDTAWVNYLNDPDDYFRHYKIDEFDTNNQQALHLAYKLGYKKGHAEAARLRGEILLLFRDDTRANFYLQFALKTFTELNNKRGLATTLNNLGTYYIRRDQNAKAQKLLFQSRQLFEELNDRQGIGRVTSQLGDIYYQNRDYPSALKYYQKAIKIQLVVDDKVGTATTLNRMGDLCLTTMQPHRALDYYKKAYQVAKENYLNNLLQAEAGLNIGKVYHQLRNYSPAIYYLKKSLEAQDVFFGRNHSIYHNQMKAEVYLYMGEIYKARTKYKQALAYLQKALQTISREKKSDNPSRIKKYSQVNPYLSTSLEEPISEAYILKRVGQIYYELGNYSKALENSSQSLNLAREQGLIQTEQDTDLLLSLIYASMQEHAKAYDYYNQYMSINNKPLVIEPSGKWLESLNLNWKELQLKERELNQVEERNDLFRSASFFVFIPVVLLLLVIWQNRRNEHTSRLLADQSKLLEQQRIRELEQTFDQKLAETEMAGLRAQMNPHFIFNCLNSIKLYTVDQEAHKASEYLTKFARLIRLVLENSRSDRVTLSDELEALRLYAEMEIMRFKSKLSFSIEIDPVIDTEFVEIPPLLIQPYLENAIWHGLMHKEEGGTVWVKVVQHQDNLLQVSIRDNGVGRAKAMELKSKSATKRKSYGMKLTGDRLELINQLYHTQTQVQILDLIDGTGQPAGTEVILQIPV